LKNKQKIDSLIENLTLNIQTNSKIKKSLYKAIFERLIHLWLTTLNAPLHFLEIKTLETLIIL